MTASTGAIVFWFITIGLSVGFFSNLIFKERGISMLPSMAMGILGSAVGGCLALFLNMSGILAFALIGAVGFLFIANSFRQKDKSVFIDKSEA